MGTGFIFGWAKPVPITWSNLHRPQRDMALVALAGPGNLLMALAWAAIGRIALYLPSLWAARPLFYMSYRRNYDQRRTHGLESFAAAAPGREPGLVRLIARPTGLAL